VQHDPRARRADRMPERDRAAVDVELVFVEQRPARPAVRARRGRMRRPAMREGTRAPARERLVDFPRVDVGERELLRCSSGVAA
jgi:hypothetical protein